MSVFPESPADRRIAQREQAYESHVRAEIFHGAPWFTCPTCGADRITTAQAYDVVSGVLVTCRSCGELAWLLVARDLDECYGVPA